MGTDKATLVVRGRPMAGWVAGALVGAGCAAVVAVGGDPRRLAELDLDVVPDVAPGEGPLGGLVVALGAAAERGYRWAAVVPCDLPDLDPETLRPLLERSRRGDVDAVLATTDRLEPLCGVWATSAHDRLNEAFSAGERSIRRAVRSLSIALVPVRGTALRNVNVPADLAD